MLTKRYSQVIGEWVVRVALYLTLTFSFQSKRDMNLKQSVPQRHERAESQNYANIEVAKEEKRIASQYRCSC